jgi:hypothetical protein
MIRINLQGTYVLVRRWNIVKGPFWRKIFGAGYKTGSNLVDFILRVWVFLPLSFNSVSYFSLICFAAYIMTPMR